MHPGIPSDELDRQLAVFRRGVSPARLLRACTPGDGIQVLEDLPRWVSKYTDAAGLEVMKFVPASGAASRMFKHLFAFPENEGDPMMRQFQEGFDRFPFVGLLEEHFRAKGESIRAHLSNGAWETVCKAIIESDGLNYGQVPKGLVAFHRYPQGERTAFVEHLFEGRDYAASSDGIVRIHFTVPAGQEAVIREHLIGWETTAGGGFDIGMSIQFPHTDTVAVDLDNQPVMDATGTMVFRPGGHGALINNLAQIDADLVFIKNIDNVQPEHLRPISTQYKQALAGFLLHHKQLLDGALQELLELGKVPSKEVQEALVRMGYNAEHVLASPQSAQAALDRPLRICGMVRNQGEPGGGPFWVEDADGRLIPQIVEKAQIDTSDPAQMNIVSESTHFNPVDLVCAVRRYDGTCYNLLDFVDPSAAFITEKSIGGNPVKALEHPGLWNGAMAGWNTLFVEVPIETFSPVKTVNDLLRPEHQPVDNR